MAKRYLTLAVDGSLSITTIAGDDPNGSKLTKSLFEMSRTSDLATHFDGAVHTRDAIASGIPGHRPLSLLAEVDESDLPTDKDFRGAWEWKGGKVIVNKAKVD